MNSKPIILAISLGIILGTAFILSPPFNMQSGTSSQLIINEKPSGGDFQLTSSEGQHRLSDYKGKLVLIYFGYTFCPDICPTDLGNLSMAYQGLTQTEKDNLQILFISVDPARDTPARLQKYANYFEANIVGLTGKPGTIAEIAKRYGVIYAKVDTHDNSKNYAVDHSAFTYVVDQKGQLQTQLPHATSPKQLIKTIRHYQSHS
ncbi:SCO family protein [Thiomicrorhabdus arctica]|jgi:protein SCO1/2|uniref:SCO family protein n=1 Tax=Thiomicrorhabdus arctica TaxID=131540 RepID=UPI0003751DC5|nr:SCO family protein [Thiomicrorhabdus arctica]